MVRSDPVVYLVDDDQLVRRTLVQMLRSAGLETVGFASAQEFLHHERPNVPSCLVLDVRMPAMSGLDLQAELGAQDIQMPIIFISGYSDLPVAVQAMKAGAVDFLQKPFENKDLVAAVKKALEKSREQQVELAELEEIRSRAETLTPREREVFALVVAGLLNKQIGARLGTTEKTVKVHRARVMKKMGAGSLADLVRMAGRLGIGGKTLEGAAG